jgi:MerR family transcriptional regulator/heat shock protein HspR
VTSAQVTHERDGVYAIAVASRLARMHPQTLRKYERAGLIQPDRRAGSQRLYSDADVRRLRRIAYLVEQRGLNIAGLVVVLGMVDAFDALAPSASAAQLRLAIDEITSDTRLPV